MSERPQQVHGFGVGGSRRRLEAAASAAAAPASVRKQPRRAPGRVSCSQESVRDLTVRSRGGVLDTISAART